MGFWDIIFIDPMLNALVVLERLCFDSFGLAIIILTILVRLATLPMTLRQLHASRRMSEVGPRIQEINKKYKDPKRRQEETMKVYREAGVNPLGCLGPMIIQFPIWIALYRVIGLTVAGTPERTVELSHRLYPLPFIQHAVPLPTNFLWLDLGRPDSTHILVVLVFITTWLQTKLSTSQSTVGQSQQQQQTTKMMLWLMPLMFSYITLNVPSGLALYWVASNIIGIVMNWFVYGWRERPWKEIFIDPKSGNNAKRGPRTPRPAPAPALVEESAGDRATNKRSTDGARNARTADGQSGSKRKDSGGGGRQSAQTARTRPDPGRRRGR